MQRFRTQGGSNLYLPLPVCLSLHGTFIYHRYFVAFILAECFNTDTVEMVYVQWVSAAKPKSNSTRSPRSPSPQAASPQNLDGFGNRSVPWRVSVLDLLAGGSVSVTASRYQHSSDRMALLTKIRPSFSLDALLGDIILRTLIVLSIPSPRALSLRQ